MIKKEEINYKRQILKKNQNIKTYFNCDSKCELPAF